MNIHDIDEQLIPVPTLTKDRIHHIFNRQLGLMGKYGQIERRNGFYWPEDSTLLGETLLHDRHHQHMLKDYAWRVTEELTEATEAFMLNHMDHFMEELVDAYHFLIELTIMSGWNEYKWATMMQANHDDRGPAMDRLVHAFRIHANAKLPNAKPYLSAYAVIEALGKGMNCLKNKPWKNTHMLTDIGQYDEYLRQAHIAFMRLWINYGPPEGLYNIYFLKSEVNKFRQRSNY